MAGAYTADLASKILSTLKEGSCLLDPVYIRELCSSLLDKRKEIGKLATTALGLLNNVCGYLFDPEEGFIALKKQTVSLFAFFGEMLELSDDIPRDMRPKLEEIKKYLAESKTLIDTMEKEISELLKFVEEKAFESDFNISGTDLKKIKFRQRKILSDRSICKEYLEQTKKTFAEIEQTVSGKLLLAGVVSGAALIGGGVLAKIAVQGALAAWTAAGTAAAGTAGAGTAAAGTAAAGTAAAGTAAAGTAAAGTAAAGTAAAGTAAAGTAAAGTVAAGTAAAGTAAAGTAAAGTAAAGTAAAGTAATGTAAGSTAAARTAASTVAATGLFVLSLKLFLICCRYSMWLNEFKETVQSKLNILNIKVVAIDKRIKLLEEQLSDATE